MKLSKRNKISVVEDIYQKILKIYPFLSNKEKALYIKKSSPILKRQIKSGNQTEKTIQDLLKLLKSGMHARMYEYKKVKIRSFRKKRSPSFEIKNRILFFNIPSWHKLLGNFSGKLISACVKNIKKYDGIIIDIRENQGGSSITAHGFAGIFFEKDVRFGTTKKKNKKGRIFNSRFILKANKKVYIDKPIIILISRLCYSSSELFLAPFKIAKRATFIGERTGGGSANPISETIKIDGEKFVFRIPTWKFFLKGKSQIIEKTKINPDIFYKGKDIEEFAKNYLLKKIKNRVL